MTGLLLAGWLVPTPGITVIPPARLEVGGRHTDGRDLVGVIGHRDQTAQRGRGDPGDAV